MDSRNRNKISGRLLRRVISSWLIICMLLSVCCVNVSAQNVPGWDANVTEANVLSLLRTFDKDGYFLVSYGTKKNSHWLSYYDNPMGINSKLMDSLDTVVHEEFHDYSIVGANNQRIYTGNKHSILVNFTKIFKTSEMVRSVPKRCRTSRFTTYVNPTIPNMASDIQGIYGLFNEFSAYCWGLHNDIQMYAYYDRFEASPKIWNGFISDCASNRLAYAEFKYYMLHYLYYAKRHHPLVYKQIMANRKFRMAYKSNERRFWKLINTFEKKLDNVKGKMESRGYNVVYNDESFVAYDSSGQGSGMSLLNDEYGVLMKELSNKKYVTIHKALMR